MPQNYRDPKVPSGYPTPERACPKCGTEMELIAAGMAEPLLQQLQLCPACYLVLWSDHDGLHVRQGIPMKKGSTPPVELIGPAGEPEEC